MFKVVMRYPDGSSEEQDEIFETEQEAENYGLEQCSNYSLGGEVLHMSNPGDYPLEDEDADFEIVEING
ncbi:hypothetical protein [Arthrobacter sp. S41]|uniref:hypothetical protein n=1 Tax=Arthrobacter sp. S41 TaxID=2509721 RepID=UPI001A91C3F2|nr:hypothetical protein [Arthrobacter sp. S41]